MKLTEEQKVQYLETLWDITLKCYSGVEVPEKSLFERCVKSGDVWVINNGYRLLSESTNPFPTDYVVGYALVTPGNSEGIRPVLRSISVLARWRGVGYGGGLLMALSRHYAREGCSQIILYCKVDNPAQILYFKAGYRVTAFLRGYYKPEGDGLEMRKNLS